MSSNSEIIGDKKAKGIAIIYISRENNPFFFCATNASENFVVWRWFNVITFCNT